MATFTNQATLTYAGRSVNSNIVNGEITDIINVTKNAVVDTYTANDVVTYVVSVVNTGTTPVTGITLTDDLGAYAIGSGSVVPLTYTPDSVKLFIDGVLQPAPTVTAENPLTLTGLTVPAGSNALIVYETTTNGFTPIEAGGQVTNTATLSAPSLAEDASASKTVTAENAADLSIEKSLTPDTVPANGTITYSFDIRNTGNTDAPDDVVITDTFDPVLQNITVTFNGTPWTEGTEYNYDPTTGVFTTVAGNIPVPAATFSQNATTGEYVTVPGTAILTVSGTI